ncbi:MAG: thiamine phosphate synthase [Pseudomonadota bacterium]|nr:thiamine phosphate synthase [Pseudomonadota bacterium]MEC8378644.1 thiamine phosphate synthase [Pseudomonadota bacterium]|tara:strand:+ start:50 stop:691 length:642 start_codon:yes stop_codon:yes gene_type:complete
MKSIYAITPPNEKLENLLKQVDSLLDAGITLFQYRSKENNLNKIKNEASSLLETIKRKNGKLIINDFPEIAIEIGADGFHLGLADYLNKKNQLFLKNNKNLINENYIKGFSCKWNLEILENPPEDIIHWDYLAVGSFFETNTKLNVSMPPSKEIMMQAPLRTNKTLYAIGGISNKNITSLKMLGYKKFAISKGLFTNRPNEIEEIIKINNEKD